MPTPRLTVSQFLQSEAFQGIALEYAPPEAFKSDENPQRVTCHFSGNYTVDEVKGTLADLTRVQAAYDAALKLAEWAYGHNTHIAVAMAIHAMATPSRSAEDIWSAPNTREWVRTRTVLINDYIKQGNITPEMDGRYPWGCATVCLPPECEATIFLREHGPDTSVVLIALDHACLPVDEDLSNETTTWTFPDGSKIHIRGISVKTSHPLPTEGEKPAICACGDLQALCTAGCKRK